MINSCEFLPFIIIKINPKLDLGEYFIYTYMEQYALI
jgi:hypothetical protein